MINKKFILNGLSILGLSVFILLAFGSSEDENAPPQNSREGKIKAQFSAWDGAHIKLERMVKKSMNDPSSYEHVETVYWDRQDHLVIKTTFRGKNAFGGVVVNWVKAKVDINNGQVLSIIEQYP